MNPAVLVQLGIIDLERETFYRIDTHKSAIFGRVVLSFVASDISRDTAGTKHSVNKAPNTSLTSQVRCKEGKIQVPETRHQEQTHL